MKPDELMNRLTQLDAQMQVMRTFLFSIAATHPERARLSEAFQERIEGLMMLWRMHPDGLPSGWMEAAESARLAVENALTDKTLGAPPGRGPAH